MVYALSYRRPAYVSSSRSSVNGSEKPASIGASFHSNSTACQAGIPDALSFDRVISGGTCPVCTFLSFSFPDTHSGPSEGRWIACSVLFEHHPHLTGAYSGLSLSVMLGGGGTKVHCYD